MSAKTLRNSGKDSNNLFSRLADLPIFRGNSSGVNLLLVLTALMFIIVPIDLDKEISAERDEIEYIVAVCTNSEKTVTAEESNLFIFTPHEVLFMPRLSEDIAVIDEPDIPDGRAPPFLTA